MRWISLQYYVTKLLFYIIPVDNIPRNKVLPTIIIYNI